ncbi:MAG: alpha/beta hydrolase [Silicimonas sp.]|nr:alpha/beta hydrolase [Silicimonas sp.]
MEPAPFRTDLAEGPDNVLSEWRTSHDGLRLRVTIWPVNDAVGTILLFTGRTEYAEKYGRVANDLTSAGYLIATIDWRGQGKSERIAEDPRLGHIEDFPDFQLDVATLVQAAQDHDLPEPWYLIAHSMGGCIGLRALIEGLPVERAVFSAPMWGLHMPLVVRPLPFVLPPVMRAVGRGTDFAPGTRPENYVVYSGFEDNMLTTDLDTYEFMARHAEAGPDFALGGPSVDWVGRATTENRYLASCPRPAKPVLTFFGSDEQIVSISAIKAMHDDWPSATLRLIEGARHELMMEAPKFRNEFITESVEFLSPVQT